VEIGGDLLERSIRAPRHLDDAPPIDDGEMAEGGRSLVTVSAMPADSHAASASPLTFAKSMTAIARSPSLLFQRRPPLSICSTAAMNR